VPTAFEFEQISGHGQVARYRPPSYSSTRWFRNLLTGSRGPEIKRTIAPKALDRFHAARLWPVA